MFPDSSDAAKDRQGGLDSNDGKQGAASGSGVAVKVLEKEPPCVYQFRE